MEENLLFKLRFGTQGSYCFFQASNYPSGLKGILNLPDAQWFLDTPGLHSPRMNLVNGWFRRLKALDGVDVLLYMIAP